MTFQKPRRFEDLGNLQTGKNPVEPEISNGGAKDFCRWAYSLKTLICHTHQ
jgi:hypothetical protein